MLEAKRKTLKASGWGNKPHQGVTLTRDEVDKSWANGGFGTSCPDQLSAAVWYVLALHFGFRACHESRQMRMGDVIVHVDDRGDKYLEFVERLTKTRCGSGNSWDFNPKAWLTSGELCPVYLYQVYNQRKPPKMLAEGMPFYLATNHMRRARRQQDLV